MSPEIQAWYENYQRMLREERREAREKAREEGRKEGERYILLRQFRARFGELPAATVARVEAADGAELDRWVDRVLDAKTLAEVLDTPS